MDIDTETKLHGKRLKAQGNELSEMKHDHVNRLKKDS